MSFPNELQIVEKIKTLTVFSVLDETGSFKHSPFRGQVFEHQDKKYVIKSVENQCKYLNGGSTPFYWKIVCERL